ncbi:ketopantoate reductase family protein [Lentzea sp. NPDC060358]|uniref:ketopantoate reductase family protein n=1 Tax=Lentzea sp. NPDC060358 TaxID=3347103 RepID=UPI00364BE509
MKILMFGRGVIASIYGWALQQAGHDVEFYVRPGRAAAYGDSVDLDLVDARRRICGHRVRRKWPVRLRETVPPDHDFDLIVVSVPHHRLPGATAFLAPRVGGATVLLFGNLWTEPAVAAAALPADQVVWGAPAAGGGFGEDGVLRGTLMGSVLFEKSENPLSEREKAVRQVFVDAGLRLREHADFRGLLWLHFVSDAGLHSQGLRVGSLAGLAGRTGDMREGLLAVRELLPLLEARGVDLRRHRAALLPFRAAWLTAPVLAWLTAHFTPARVNFQAHSDPGALEPREICRDALAAARKWNVPVPRLEAAEPRFAREDVH